MKKIAKMLMLMALCATLIPMNIMAEESQEQSVESVETEETTQALTETSQVNVVDTSDAALADADELLKNYIQKQFDKELPGSESAVQENAETERLVEGTNSLRVYHELENMVIRVAAGEETDTEFVVENLEDIGVDNATGEGSTLQEALNVAYEGMDVDCSRVVYALLDEHPYEMYWYDKTAGTSYGYSYSYYTSNGQYHVTIRALTFTMPVSQDFGSGTTITRNVGTLITNAVNKAKSIVNENRSKNDYEKVVAYKEAICNLTTYNDNATDDNTNTAYGNPWQLLWVFDEDPSTAVVCEGYSKAFKYLSDLTENASFSTIVATGLMGSTSSSGAHMWNIVKMPDGKNYMVDVTNSDEGASGQDSGLFLNGYYSKDSNSQYTFQLPSGSTVSYVYDNGTIDYYADTELSLSSTDYNSAVVSSTVDLYVTGAYNYDYCVEVLNLVNQKRAEAGVPALQMDEDLYAGALRRAMEISLYFKHTRPDGSTCYSTPEFNGKCSGENIAVGQRTPQAVMDSWMDSAGHQANILNQSFKSIGIGCVVVNGYTYWVQDFGRGSATLVNPSGSETITKRIDADPSNVELSISDTSLKVNETKTLTVRAYNTFTYVTVNPESFNFTSSNTSVAVIDASGVVTGKSVGTATVTAIHKVDSSYSATATVEVTDPYPVTNIALNKASLTLKVGDSETLTATISPSNATNKTVTWSSSNSSIAKVTNAGKVTAVAKGSAIITATSSNGKTANCNVTVTAPVAVQITRQPIDQYVVNGEKATVSVAATGDGLTYQWYLKNKTSTKFSKSSVTKNTYSVTMSDTVDGRQVYCVVTDKYGNSVTSNTATLNMYISASIVTQPKDVTVDNGNKASVTVVAKGNGLTYQWYLKNKNSTKFSKSSVTKSTYSVTMSDSVDGRQVYCMVTDMHGNSATSEIATLRKKGSLEIVTQPIDCYVNNGQKATATVTATGEGLTYQWYLKNKNATNFGKSSIKTDTYSVTMSDTVDGRQVYCVITDKNGKSVTSNTVTLNKYVALSITTQPKNVSVANGQKASTTVTAKGSGLTYQWYVKNKTSTKFSKSSVTKNTYSTTMSDTVDGRKIYCIITDALGNTVQTNTVTLSKK